MKKFIYIFLASAAMIFFASEANAQMGKRYYVNGGWQFNGTIAKGGDVSDKQTIQLALDAAKKAKFTEGEHYQIGTITYTFKFN